METEYSKKHIHCLLTLEHVNDVVLFFFLLTGLAWFQQNFVIQAS